MIRFDSVTKTYRGTKRPALDDVSIEILKGEFVFLVGASGSGKSSFLRLVLKEEKASRGQIHVLGHQLASLPTRKVPYFRRSLGVVFQDFRLLPGKTVFDNVAFTLQVIGKGKGFIQEAVPDVLKLVGLEGKERRMPHELSGGEQQRVAIARAVVNKPAVLLADEPTGNLDPATSAGIMSLLAAINANGTTVVMATHDVGIVDEMRRRVIELVGGKVVRDERSGGYQTQAIPVQEAARLEADAEGASTRGARAPAPAIVQPVVPTAAVPITRQAPPAPVQPAAEPGQRVASSDAEPETAAAAAPVPERSAQPEPAAASWSLRSAPAERRAPDEPEREPAAPASAPAAAASAPAAPAAPASAPAPAASAAAPPSADEPATPQSALASAVLRATSAIDLPGSRRQTDAQRDEEAGR
jgi:cell division transport system ATP-binding protein